ncbi:MAG: aminodeoxychorismate synthase, component I [Desulfuromonas sp.]|nr:MAG: aminodeoxychorismate synthase, component I [Desulfuromonas sp.]
MTDFAVLYDHGRRCWLRFSEPTEVYQVDNLASVLSTLQTIEQRVARDRLFAAGFISYEAAPAFDAALPTKPTDDFPLLSFGLFSSCQPVELPSAHQPRSAIDWQPTITQADFTRSVNLIHDAIACGETYQVNFTFPLEASLNCDPWQFFCQLVHGQQAGASGYLSAGRWAICSASPELFFARQGGQLTMRPMKGTAPRGRTLVEDRLFANCLQQSVKDRAENIMILDMVRNDLGRVAPPGSVKVEELCALEKYPTLWQLTSTASATSSASLSELFCALFPCASITGAPKARTMQIINRLETEPRRIYTGSFGWLAPDGAARFSVAIRTALIDRQLQSASYGVGAGITWDSQSADEYHECMTKALVLKQPWHDYSLIETLRWSPFKGYFLFEEHLSRLRDSCAYFDFPYDEDRVRRRLAEATEPFTATTAQRVRLLLNNSGQVDVSFHPLDTPPKQPPLHARLARSPVDSSDRFLYHKTTRRHVYNDALAEAGTVDEVLLCNERGELTEFTIGNLVVERDGRLLTPPIDSGLLPGTYRRYLLERGVIEEQVLRIGDMQSCKRLWLINAVRKWCRVILDLGSP